jgi:hypothetical protein
MSIKLFGDHLIVPVARYAYPAIIPTMLINDIGWLEIANWQTIT